jgi:hypothetical protein
MASKLLKEFFTGGKAYFTVKVPEAFASEKGCNLHYTFRIEQADPTEKYPNPAHFVKLLTGPNNTEDYTYMGILNPKTGEVRHTANSKIAETAWSFRIVRRVLAQIFEGEGMPAIQKHGWDVDHMGRCGRCARPLTVPESIELGIGPDCAEQMGIPYPTRSKASKPRCRKVKVVAEAVTDFEPERDPASDQEPPQIGGSLPALPDDEVFF